MLALAASVLDGHPVLAIGNYVFCDHGSLTDISLPDNLTTIYFLINE